MVLALVLQYLQSPVQNVGAKKSRYLQTDQVIAGGVGNADLKESGV